MELKGARGNKDEKCFDCLIEPVSECVFQQVIYQSSCCIRDRSNINRTQTSLFGTSIDDGTGTPNFWLRMNGHQALIQIGSSLDLLTYSLNRLQHRILEHPRDSTMFTFW